MLGHHPPGLPARLAPATAFNDGGAAKLLGDLEIGPPEPSGVPVGKKLVPRVGAQRPFASAADRVPKLSDQQRLVQLPPRLRVQKGHVLRVELVLGVLPVRVRVDLVKVERAVLVPSRGDERGVRVEVSGGRPPPFELHGGVAGVGHGVRRDGHQSARGRAVDRPRDPVVEARERELRGPPGLQAAVFDGVDQVAKVRVELRKHVAVHVVVEAREGAVEALDKVRAVVEGLGRVLGVDLEEAALALEKGGVLEVELAFWLGVVDIRVLKGVRSLFEFSRFFVWFDLALSCFWEKRGERKRKG